MGNAIWVFLMVPRTYFGAIRAPLSSPPYNAIFASGVLALLLSCLVALVAREPAVLWAIVPFVLSQLCAGTAGYFRGRVRNPGWILFPFLLFQLVAAGFIIFASDGSYLAGALMAWSTIIYGLLAFFVSAMAFTNTWV